MKGHILRSILIVVILGISLAGCASIANYTTGYGPTESPVLPSFTNTVPAPTTPTTITPTAPAPTTVPTPTTVPSVPAVNIVMELTENVKNELSTAWVSFANEELKWESKNNIDDNRVQYHGSFNDKHILVIVEDCPVVTVNYDLHIGPYVLSNYAPFEIYVYSDGEFTPLKTAYEELIFTDEEVAAVFESLETVFSAE